MSDYHFCVKQVCRSKGQSSVSSAAYRSGERLYSEYYGEYSDYTNKTGIVLTGIMLPENAPEEFSDRQTLWNSVEVNEKNKKAQLAYSFDFSLQNEFTMEENIEIASEYIRENFVAKGMIADFAVHLPDKKDGGIPNPHVHVMCPIRPLDKDGKWGQKQKRVYELDKDGNRVRSENGSWKFAAVPTTDWGAPETLEQWRKAWAEINNRKFREKGMDARIDHRSFDRQGLDLIPTVHEGANIRQMEAKGIVTEKGSLNRWIRATNRLLSDIRLKIKVIREWISEMKKEKDPKERPVLEILMEGLDRRNKGAWSNKAKVMNLKKFADLRLYLQEKDIVTIRDLEERITKMENEFSEKKTSVSERSKRMQEIREILHYRDMYEEHKPVFDEMNSNKKYRSAKMKESYREEHAPQLKAFFVARRKLQEFNGSENTEISRNALLSELEELKTQQMPELEILKEMREELGRIFQVKGIVNAEERKENMENAKAEKKGQEEKREQMESTAKTERTER